MDHPTQIYFSNDLKKHYQDECYLLGYQLNNIYIIFCTINESSIPNLPKGLKDLKIIGTLNKSNTSYDINLVFDKTSKILQNPTKSSFIIYFDPPNFKNLEYFSINPILLQSIGHHEPQDQETQLLNEKLAKSEPKFKRPHNQSFISDENVLEKINHLYRNRLLFKQFQSNKTSTTTTVIHRIVKSFVHSIIIPLVIALQNILIFIISIINWKLFNVSLVDVSKVFRQFDLRLKQFNYFPTQFLCYYDKNILYSHNNKIIEELKLPIFNSNLNINNSNYINLYNSIWLIFNDILIGVTIHQTVIENLDKIIMFIKDKIIEKYLFEEMFTLITWITTKNPAGFKLNTDLGQFLGDLYIWTMWFWKILIDKINVPSNYYTLLKILKILCYCGGCSFLIGFLIDCITLITFHIYGFYYCSAKVYRRQLDIIKSLFQLFRGKKYNILKNRIDNLNNYEINDSFEIDQLLLGTLLFMMMIFLLPTVFAFYLVFCCLHVIILMSFNLLENLSIIICFTPLFVILLKLKNSKRLQGGLKFEYLQHKNGTTLITLSNKALTYSEIFTNFIKLFKRAKNFRNAILLKFLSGQIISIEYDYNLKFNYLMLPQEYSETINIWKFVK
ncbi:gpi1 N-acetylglucosaminyl-phosphatidylinositol biosynthetic protein gpi1 [Candida maltosa Xu316]